MPVHRGIPDGLRNTRLRWRPGRGLRRTALLVALVGVTFGAAVLTAVPALAVTGTQFANLGLNPTEGSAYAEPGWFTQDGCPSGFQGSAVLYELNTDGSIARSISPVVTNVSAKFSGTLLAPVGQLITMGSDVTDGGTSQWVVGCFAGGGGTGSVEYVQSTYVSLSTDGSTYSSFLPKFIATTTTLTASPNPAEAGTPVTLTATVTGADGGIPPGVVEFAASNSNTAIAVAPLNASGVATTTTTFAALGTEPGTVVLSTFLLNSGPSYASSTATYAEIVDPAGTLTAGAEPITATVPPSGTFTLTIMPGTVTLTTTNNVVAGGTLQDVTVTDTRNTYPGWSVSGQESDFTGSGTAAGHTISGNQLGWEPFINLLARADATAGPIVNPAVPGLGSTAATLASAAAGHGFGTYPLSALLYLAIPPTTPAGPYSGLLTITAVDAAP